MHKFPFVSVDESFSIYPRMNGAQRFGTYGTVVYGYRGPFAYADDIGLLYHPVDSEEEAKRVLDYYRGKMRVNPGFHQKEFTHAAFIPSPLT